MFGGGETVTDKARCDIVRHADRPARRSRPWLWALFVGLLGFDLLACWLLLWQHDTTAGFVCLGVSVIFERHLENLRRNTQRALVPFRVTQPSFYIYAAV